ncbi:YbhB/YbcL family Raf kinase inhibitor-like protein [Streptomyces sp. NPDC087297]|uniref:YbhB/YbcL family Raf kinase inhibitor-like protein n=1 Tax=Streptomyces sp. NPDC087297 TaxID=3365778 RepID=UPI0037F7E12A
MKKSPLTTTGGTAAVAVAVPEAAAPATPPIDPSEYGYGQVRSGVPASAERFTVTSPDVRDGEALPAETWADAFGCTGENRQPRLSWSGAPQATRSYAITMFDPDAPTGAGFWHWLVLDVPAGHTGLDTGLPAGAVSGVNDSGSAGYLGPCPPIGDLTHHYEITVYALDVPTLGLPASTPPTIAAFMMSRHIIGYARITGTVRR